MGSYEPGRCGERVRLMGVVSVSVIDLMGRKGEASAACDFFELENAQEGALVLVWVRKRQTPSR